MNDAEAIDVAEIAVVKGQGFRVADAERGRAVVDFAAPPREFDGLVGEIARPQLVAAATADLDRPEAGS